MRLGGRVAAVLLLGSLAACGQESGTPTADGETTAPEAGPPGGPDLAGPPPLTLHRPEGEVDLEAYTWCYHDEDGVGCADGPRPEDPPETAAEGPLTFSFPLDGWSFAADFRVPGKPDSCDRYLRADAVPQGDGTFVVPPLGPAGHWQVNISGWADKGGDLFTAFDWTTPNDSTETSLARGEVGLLGPPSVYDDKELEAYGPSLYLTGLAAEPAEATAEVVLSDGSARARYRMKPVRGDGCPGDGAVAFSGDAPGEALDLPDLGEPPYSYEVHLTMDGRSYTGTGRWPDDLTPPSSNSLALTWSPPLPAWDGSGGSRGPGGSVSVPSGEADGVTPFVLQLEGGPVELAPWTHCLAGCVDGMPPDQPYDVGDPGEVAFTFDRPGWEFTATFHKRGDCARKITLPVEQTAATNFLVRPIGPAGEWDVDLFGSGDGDAITTFQWHTPVDGRLAEAASGTVGVLAEHDGELDSYGVELFLTDLAEQPREATAVITATSAEGRTATIEPRRSPRCHSEGEVSFKASRSQGLSATRIGQGPFTYTVDVTLDGRTYLGTGEWPTDTNPEIVPHVPLTWEPALPVYGG